MPHNVPAQIAANVRVELARHNMRQKDLAERIDMKPAMLSHRLQGRTALSLHEVDLIASALDVPVGTLLQVVTGVGQRAGDGQHDPVSGTASAELPSRQARVDGLAADTGHGGESS